MIIYNKLEDEYFECSSRYCGWVGLDPNIGYVSIGDNGTNLPYVDKCFLCPSCDNVIGIIKFEVLICENCGGEIDPKLDVFTKIDDRIECLNCLYNFFVR